MARLTNTFEGRVYELMQAGFPRQEAIAIAQRERADAGGSSPADLDPVEAAAAPIPDDPQAGATRYDPVVRPRRPAPAPQGQDYGRTVPGPRTMDGSDPAPGRQFASQEEADAYYKRPEDPNNPGLFLPSQADADMRKRGFVPVMTPDGVRYQLEAQDSRYPVGYGMQGSKPWLEGGTRTYKPLSAGDGAGLDVSDNDGGVPLEYVRTPAPSPLTGEGSQRGQVYKLGPGQAVREYNKDMQLERQAIRMANDAGMPVEQFVAENPQFKVLLRSPSAVARLKVAENRRQEQQERRDAWRAQAMLAGGNRAKNAVNAMRMLPEDQQSRVLAYWASGGQGATPLDVESQQLQAAAQLAQRAVQGALINNPQAIAAQQAAQMAADAEKRKRRQADEDVIANKYAPASGLGWDEFTVAEQQEMYERLIEDYGYTPAEAQAAVDRIAYDRTTVGSNPKWSPAN